MKIKSIDIKNFRTHTNSHIDLCDGLNTIVGDNDAGKSNILRALEWVLYNTPASDSVIRVGKSYAEVTVTLDNNVKVQRIRGKINKQSVNRYAILRADTDKWEVYDAIGRDVPFAVRDSLGVSYFTRAGASSPDQLSILKQSDPPFLLTETVRQRAVYLNAFTGSEAIDQAAKDARSDVRDTTKIINESSKRAENLKTKIGELSGIDAVKSQMNDVSLMLSIIKSDEVLQKFTKERRDYILEAQNCLNYLNEWLTSQDKYRSLLKLPETIEAYQEELEKLSSLRDTVDSCICKSNVLSSAFDKGVVKLSNAENMLNSVTKLAANLVYYTDKHNNLLTLASRLNMLKVELAATERNTQEAESIYNNKLRQLGVCPVCGGDTTHIDGVVH